MCSYILTFILWISRRGLIIETSIGEPTMGSSVKHAIVTISSKRNSYISLRRLKVVGMVKVIKSNLHDLWCRCLVMGLIHIH